MEELIDIVEKYETRCGYEARVHATDFTGEQPVLYSYKKNGDWYEARATKEGYYLHSRDPSGLDLVKVSKQCNISNK